MTPTRYRLDEGFEYGDAATTSRKSLAARRAVDAGKWRPAAPKAPRQRNAAPEYIVVSKQLLESKPTVPPVKRVPPRTSGESFAAAAASLDTFGGASVSGDVNAGLGEDAALRLNVFAETLASHRDVFDGER